MRKAARLKDSAHAVWQSAEDDVFAEVFRVQIVDRRYGVPV